MNETYLRSKFRAIIVSPLERDYDHAILRQNSKQLSSFIVVLYRFVHLKRISEDMKLMQVIKKVKKETKKREVNSSNL